MKKALFSTLLLLFLPCFVYASTEEMILSEETRYFKTITCNNDYVIYGLNNSISETFEISKEEYEQQWHVSQNSTTIETTYKKMTTSILSSNSNYKYKVKLEWKNIPKVRSYDTIAIGFPASVKIVGSPIFNENYCITNDSCYDVSGFVYSFIGRNGVGITFKVPASNIFSMEQTLFFIVEKNTSSIITTQYAYGDYAHATKNLSLDKADDYTVTTAGINHGDASITYYDEISTARASWTGVW